MIVLNSSLSEPTSMAEVLWIGITVKAIFHVFGHPFGMVRKSLVGLVEKKSMSAKMVGETFRLHRGLGFGLPGRVCVSHASFWRVKQISRVVEWGISLKEWSFMKISKFDSNNPMNHEIYKCIVFILFFELQLNYSGMVQKTAPNWTIHQS